MVTVAGSSDRQMVSAQPFAGARVLARSASPLRTLVGSMPDQPYLTPPCITPHALVRPGCGEGVGLSGGVWRGVHFWSDFVGGLPVAGGLVLALDNSWAGWTGPGQGTTEVLIDETNNDVSYRSELGSCCSGV